jgi:hypothetical protein
MSYRDACSWALIDASAHAGVMVSQRFKLIADSTADLEARGFGPFDLKWTRRTAPIRRRPRIDCSKRSVIFFALKSPTAVRAFRIHAVD